MGKSLSILAITTQVYNINGMIFWRSPTPPSPATSQIDQFLHQSDLDALKKQYQTHKFTNEMIILMNKIAANERNPAADEHGKVNMKHLKGLISVKHPNESDKNKLMITLESLSMDNFKYDLGTNRLWLHSILHSQLCQEAVKQILIPSLDQIQSKNIDSSIFPDSGIIIFTDVPLPTICHQSSEYYTNWIAKKIQDIANYPFLKTSESRWSQIRFLAQVFHTCPPIDNPAYLELIDTLNQVMANMINHEDERWRIWNNELWKDVIKFGLIPNDSEVQDWISGEVKGIDLVGSISLFKGMLRKLEDRRQKYPYLNSNYGFLVEMGFLKRLFTKFADANELKGLDSLYLLLAIGDTIDLDPVLVYFRREYKQCQLHPTVIQYINNLFSMLRKSDIDQNERKAISFVLSMIIVGDDDIYKAHKRTKPEKGSDDDSVSDDEKLMKTLESLTKDMIDYAGDDNIWNYQYLYSSIYDRAVQERLIPDMDGYNGANQDRYAFAKQYNIIIFTGDNIEYNGKSDADKTAVLNSMSQEQKYPFLPIIIKERSMAQ